MIIKSFTAESATAAMKMVRKEMGGEAIVLKTRQVVDRHNRPGPSRPLPRSPAETVADSTFLAAAFHAPT